MEIASSSTVPAEIISLSGALIVGAGPSGLAAAACLGDKGVPYTIIERADCIASLWKHKTYDRIHLHIPKQHSQLPMMPFPEDCPDYPSGAEFVKYLEDYACEFNVQPSFNMEVIDARYVEDLHKWQVEVLHFSSLGERKVVFHALWLVVATGENADAFIPEVPNMSLFDGPAIHSSKYRNGECWSGKEVLVVGSGNSGFEVALDLANHGANPSLHVRKPFHVLPREMFGRSTFEVAMWMKNHGFPYSILDIVLVWYANIFLGNSARYGIPRPSMGPLRRKDVEGVTPVLDVGTLQMIRAGKIQVVKGLNRITTKGAVFLHDESEVEQSFDAIVWATGFRSSVPKWLHDDSTFDKNGIPYNAFPHSWLGERGLFTVGFTKRGLLGAGKDAIAVASMLSEQYKKKVEKMEKKKKVEKMKRDLIEHVEELMKLREGKMKKKVEKTKSDLIEHVEELMKLREGLRERKPKALQS